jgi:hypothetical protein
VAALQYLSKLNETTRLALLRVLGVKRFDPRVRHGVVCLHGAAGDECYIVHQGSVGIYQSETALAHMMDAAHAQGCVIIGARMPLWLHAQTWDWCTFVSCYFLNLVLFQNPTPQKAKHA